MGKRRRLGLGIGVVALACASFGASTAAAQVDYEIMASLQFNFSNPGARSLAMAGALTGAGDDATGAWTNPGGLTNITRPEVGVEFRGFSFKTPFVDVGRFNGTTLGGFDNLPPPVLKDFSENTTQSLSFVSAVVPKSRFAFAFYRTEVANFETDIETEGPYQDRNRAGDPDPDLENFRIFPVTGSLELNISNFGGSAAVRLTDQISIGAGLSYYQFELDSNTRRFLVNPLDGRNIPGFFLGPPLRTNDNVRATEVIEGDDSALGVNIGASISPNEKIRFGASYRQGPKFDLSFSRTDEDGALENEGTGEFKVPDVIALGVLVKPFSSLNIAADYRRVQYSQLTDNMSASTTAVDASDYVLDDADEFRVAGEYLIGNLSSPLSAIALRGGFWFDPDHRIRYTGPAASDTVLFFQGEDEMHYTAGAGIVFEKFQFDVGFDWSELVNTFSVSAVFRF